MPEMAVIKFRAKRGVYADTRGEFPWLMREGYNPTIQEAIEREILPALGGYAEDFDVRAIADDVFEYVTPEDDRGRVRVDRAGFVPWDVRRLDEVLKCVKALDPKGGPRFNMTPGAGRQHGLTLVTLPGWEGWSAVTMPLRINS